ncbi:MAG: hypothetical protein HYV35_04855 [Lentisphaerae bacterium]|nr:hypothetical protein [Lentisphaerota bacterium]
MNLPISLAPRTLVSVIRTSIYGGLGAFLAISDAEAKSVVDAMVIGGVLADFVTWLIMNVISLPGNLAHGCYEGCLNLLFALFLLHFGYVSAAPDLGGQSMAIAFLIFMLVLGLKTVWYVAIYVADVSEG